MKITDYLGQAYRLDLRINSHIEELDALNDMISSISSPKLSERVSTSPTNEAPFVKTICKMVEMQDLINSEIDKFVDLKKQIREVIDAVSNPNEAMVLRYRYISNLTWEDIAVEMHADKSTVRRWHSTALTKVKLPENPIII